MHEKPKFIENRGQLRNACLRWMEFDAVGIDTEFERTRTYFSRPALVLAFRW